MFLQSKICPHSIVRIEEEQAMARFIKQIQP